MKLAIVTSLIAASTAALNAQVDFTKSIQPIFENVCLDCHGPEKDKGDLRLHTKETAFGGNHVIVPGKPDESELLRRISLPPDDIDIMPPKGDPLTKEKIELVRKWITEGAKWPDGLVLGDGAAPAQAANEEPEDEFSALKPAADPAAEKAAIEKLAELGVSVRPIAQNLQWKEATVRPLDPAKAKEAVALLKDIPTLVDLNLATLKISDEDLKHIAGLSNLLRLHLENTPITDKGTEHLKGLVNLRYLNLYNTDVTDEGLKNLAGLAKLRNLYLWQTKVTDQGAQTLHASIPQATINRGADAILLAKVVTETAAAETQPAPASGEAPAAEGSVELKLEKASLAQALDLYGSLVGGRLLLDPQVAASGKQITVNSGKKLNKQEAAEMLEAALREQAGIEFNRTITATLKAN